MTRADHLEGASAFFALFTHSEWGSAYVRTSEIEIFVARGQDARNPMVAAPIDGGLAPDQGDGGELRAPHIGTVAELVPIGTQLAAGECYARLELLGETIELIVDEAAIVADHLLPIGALAEFDQPLVRLR